MKEINLLEAQLQKLDQKEFDLQAWKQYTVVLLARIFGSNDPKIRQVEKIEYDFSSWALRDTTGKSAYMETCKKLGREIIQASIDELKAFGLPSKDIPEEAAISIDVILSALEDELKISEFRKLTGIINSEKKQDEKRKEINALVDTFDKEFCRKFILDILSHPGLKNKL